MSSRKAEVELKQVTDNAHISVMETLLGSIRFNIDGLVPKIEATLMDPMAADGHDGKDPDDDDIILGQIVAIEILQQENERLNDEITRLRISDRDQTMEMRRFEVVKEDVRRVGEELMASGKLLIEMVSNELSDSL